MGLSVSHDIGRGDDALLREALLDAKQSLQEARGKLLTGYEGERDLKQVAEDILALAESIDEEMQAQRNRERRAKVTVQVPDAQVAAASGSQGSRSTRRVRMSRTSWPCLEAVLR